MLKVMFYDEKSFYNEYGMLYSALNPNVEIEVVTMQDRWGTNGSSEDPEEMLQKIIDESQPDVLFLSSDEYDKFSSKGSLLDLTPFIEQDKYNTDNMIPGILEFLKEKGGGTLYGLSPSFYSQALFYNKDLFEKYGVEPPTDRMSWEDVIARASRFPTDGSPEERVYGLKNSYRTSLFEFATSIGDTLGLSIFTTDPMQVTLDTPAWQNAFSTALDAIRSGTLYVQDDNMMRSWSSYEEYLMADPFISGRAAMMIENVYMMDQLQQAAEQLKDKVSFNWDLVTVPVDPANPDYTTTASVDQIFAINATSTNSKEAWNFIKYIHSDEYARVKSKTYNGGSISIRSGYFKDDEGRNVEAFYTLKPTQSPSRLYYSELPSFYGEFMGLANSKLEPVVKENASLEEALRELQQESEQLMLRVKQEQDEMKSTSETENTAETDATGGSDGATIEVSS